MSSDRLFLDRVARQHCPSPLHRHAQTTMHPRPARLKQDISTLQRIGHFYFALTMVDFSRGRPLYAGGKRVPEPPTARTGARLPQKAAPGSEVPAPLNRLQMDPFVRNASNSMADPGSPIPPKR